MFDFSYLLVVLIGVCARSMDELTASLKRAVTGVAVEHVMQVCDMWSFLKPFAQAYSLFPYYSFEIAKNTSGHVVLRYKTTMHSDTWLPCGHSPKDRAFAPRMLHKAKRSEDVPDLLRFTVPSVIPIESLRSMISSYEHRLTRPRSALRFPEEHEGACVAWWHSFLSHEEARVADMCATCVDIKRELGTIVVRRSKSLSLEKKEQNLAKQRRKGELLEELKSHDCEDRRSGKLDVPGQYSWILQSVLRSFSSGEGIQGGLPDPEQKQKHVNKLPANLHDGFSDSASDSEGYMEETDGLGLLKRGQSKPAAYRRRGNRIKKGMFIATLSDASDEHMGAQPFWIQKVLRVTKRRVKVQYYGPEFLGVYKPLLDVDRDDTPYVDYFKRGEFTTLHWNIKFVGKYASHDGGRLSANDQAYLRLDVRVPWNSACSSSSSSRSSGRSKRSRDRSSSAAQQPHNKKPKN